jgi:hypothetical protein
MLGLGECVLGGVFWMWWMAWLVGWLVVVQMGGGGEAEGGGGRGEDREGRFEAGLII